MYSLTFVFFINLLFFRPATTTTTDPFTVYSNCLHNATLSSTFQQNVNLALGNLKNLSSSGVKYNITHTGFGIDQAYALIQCRGDQSLQGCSNCVSKATTMLRNDCPSSIGARIQLDDCYLRYDNQAFFTPDFTHVKEYCYAPASDTSVALESLLENVINAAPKNGGYAAASAGGLYALAQCLGYLQESECSQCLALYKTNPRCEPGEQWHSVSCYYRYETYSFFTPTTPSDFTVYDNCLHYKSLSSTFHQNLLLALGDLKNLSSSGAKYNITSTGSDIDKAYALFQCRGDQSLHGCSDCVSNAITMLQNDCLSSIGARIQLDNCYLRYDNQAFFTPDFTQVSEYCYAPASTTSVALESLMENVTNEAPKHGGYAAESAGGLYALVQCLGYLNESECSQCLASYKSRERCNSNKGVPGEQWHSVSCYYRYEAYSFFTPTPPPSSTLPSPGSTQPASTTHETKAQRFQLSGRKIAIVIVGAVVGPVCATVALYLTLVWRHRAKARQDLHAQNAALTQPCFEHKAKVFSLHELEVATRDFNPDNKLGQGGFGPVYKGTLPNGQHVAVKKLSLQSQQGKRQFTNEVNLITSVQHRNLIKLLGSCVEGHERILVYEYLPNKSVDALLFGDSMDGRTLDWPTCCGIILGMARGLTYLHEESPARIIHRDIKPSNILLDDQFNPIIADFGLARLFSDEESHITTTVAGTLGYLAPEYVAHGELTEKADVFSFGIVTLELISGRRNSDIGLSAQNESLLEWTWRLYRQQRQLELVDPKLHDSFVTDQFIRVVHVALLCTQEIAVLRPTMSTVTLMLSGRSNILEIPTKPAFVVLKDL